MTNSAGDGGTVPSSTSAKAASRAAQVSEHLSTKEDSQANTGKRRRKAKQDELPADYSDLLILPKHEEATGTDISPMGLKLSNEGLDEIGTLQPGREWDDFMTGPLFLLNFE